MPSNNLQPCIPQHGVLVSGYCDGNHNVSIFKPYLDIWTERWVLTDIQPPKMTVAVAASGFPCHLGVPCFKVHFS